VRPPLVATDVAQSAEACRSFMAFGASTTLQVVVLVAAVATLGAVMSNPPTLTHTATADIGLRMASPPGANFRLTRSPLKPVGPYVSAGILPENLGGGNKRVARGES